MNLIINKVMQLKVVHITNGNGVIELLARSAVDKRGLAVLRPGQLCEVKPCAVLAEESVALLVRLAVKLADILLVSAVENGCRNLPAERLCNIAEVNLEYLSDIHSRRNAEGVKNDIQRSTVGQEGHILLLQNAGNDALVTVTTSHLVADGNLTLLRDVNANLLVYAGSKLVAVLAVKGHYVNNNTAYAVRQTQRVVANLARLLAENRAQQSFLGGEVGFALRRNLADEDIARVNLRADTDNSALVKFLQSVWGEVGDIVGDFLGAELCFTALEFVFFYMNRGVYIVVDKLLVDENRVLVVVALPRHKADESVLSERDFAVLGCGTVCDNLTLGDTLALAYNRALVYAVALVASLELDKLVDMLNAVVGGDYDVVCAYLGDNTVFLCAYDNARVNGSLVLNTCADDRLVCYHKRNRLTLHVRAHKSTVRVVVLEERNHRGSDGNNHLRRNVHKVNLLALNLKDCVAAARVYTRALETAVVVKRLVRLCDDVVVLDVCRHINNLVKHSARRLVNATVGRFDKAVYVNSRKGCEVGDKSDVGSFGSFYRAHSSVVGVVYVTNLEACAVTRQTARTERGQTALVSKLCKRVVLVHKLRQRRGAEELLHRGDNLTRVNKRLGSNLLGVATLNAHSLADNSLHTGKADSEVVLKQLAYRTDTSVSEVVDIVNITYALAEVHKVAH